MLRKSKLLQGYSDSELAKLALEGLVYEKDGYLLPTVSGEAPAFVQSKGGTNDNAGTPIGATFDNPCAAGNLIIVGVTWSDADEVPTCSDTVSNPYTHIPNCHILDTVNSQQSTAFYAKNIAAGTPTVNVAFSIGKAFRRIIIMEVSGCDTSAPLDQSTGQTQASPGTGTNGITSGAVTTTTDGQFIWGFCMDNETPNTITAGSGFTGVELNTGSSAPAAAEYQVQSTAGSIAATFTQTVNHRHTNLIATFKAAAGIAGTPIVARKPQVIYLMNRNR